MIIRTKIFVLHALSLERKLLMLHNGLPMKEHNILYLSSHYSDHRHKNIIIYKYLIFLCKNMYLWRLYLEHDS